MKKERPGLITIQKFIYLLSDFYYTEFVTNLADINASLPLKLVQTIRNRLPGFDSHEELCKKIYGSFEKGPKQSFNQLASYTLRLSAVLAQNYPDYLRHNIFKLQRLVNEGKGEEANFLAGILLDVSERTEDFQCRIFVLNFFSQQAYIKKNTVAGLKLDNEIADVLNKEKSFVEIQLFTRKKLAEVKLQKKELEFCKKYLLGFAADSSVAVRILSRHSYLLILYQFDLQAFKQPYVAEIVEQLEKDLGNQSHIVFPYLLDLKSSLFFMKLNSTLKDVNSKENEREFEELSAHYKAIRYWKTFVNMGQLYLITIQCTRLFDKYENLIYRADYHKSRDERDKILLREYQDKCREILKSDIDTVKYGYEIMSYRILYGALLIISGGRNTIVGIEELEAVLVNYREVNLNTETDSIFMCLMSGYFALKNYAGCDKTFRRYLKSIKGKPVFEDNDFRINTYYYAALWLKTKNRKYPLKLKALLEGNKNSGVSKTANEIIEYFKIPC